MSRHALARRFVLVLAAAALGAAGIAAQGCYERVVGARGLGASTYSISEPYQENSGLDDWVFGKRPSNDKIVRPPPPE